ncbi:beta-galactosidase GalB [Nibricoccus sp. IMCC34717]|uniref:beta-galactosidase GalB n=1 Tax=Nibricoccus sp. IMCC34717 TaxID=3034021 RepID=UPI003850BEE0
MCSKIEVQRKRICFDADWLFTRQEPVGAEQALKHEAIKDWLEPMGANLLALRKKAKKPKGTPPGEAHPHTQAGCDTRSWLKLDLPHDWAVDEGFDPTLPGETGRLRWVGVGWYRKTFNPGRIHPHERVHLEIDGAMSHALIWCNGKFLGGWPYGYASWSVELTQHLQADATNTIAIRLENEPYSSRWYPGAGLYRHVWLTRHNRLHVDRWGVHVRTRSVSGDRACLRVETDVRNATGDPEQMTLTNRLYEPLRKGAKVVVKTWIHEVDEAGQPAGAAVAFDESTPALVHDGYAHHFSQELEVQVPKLWSLDKRSRYAAVTEIWHEGNLADQVATPFGIRTAEFRAGEGFFLNGKRIQLNGVCNHHDLGPLGAALNECALERQLRILADMGCNALRTAHNPPAPELLELCDRLGILVIAEAFDCWAAPKKPNDYHKLFPDWHEKDLRAFVRRDRNHPSIILWSIGNEIGELWKPEGFRLAKHLSAIVKQEDDTRPTTAGYNDTNAGFNGFETAVDVVGFNYRPTLYNEFLEKNPDTPVYGSETSSCVSSRGEYFFPVQDDKLSGRAGFHVSSYDLYAPEWAFPPEVEFKGLDLSPACAGEFVWTGFDYLGEPTPYNPDPTNVLNYADPIEREKARVELERLGGIQIPSRSSYFGIVDLCGFPKDRFYLYQSRWRPETPVAHLLPHWNWPGREGEITPVHAYSNGDEAELFLNGLSQGRLSRQPYSHRFRWDAVRYSPGVIELVTYRNGREWARCQHCTPGMPATLQLDCDRSEIEADGRTLSFVTVSVRDRDGKLVPDAKVDVHYQIEGPGEIVAVDNGDPTSHLPFKGTESRTFNGLALAILRPVAGRTGDMILRASNGSLSAGQISLRAVAR